MIKRYNILVLLIALIVSAGIWINALTRNNKKKEKSSVSKSF